MQLPLLLEPENSTGVAERLSGQVPLMGARRPPHSLAEDTARAYLAHTKRTESFLLELTEQSQGQKSSEHLDYIKRRAGF